MAMISGLATMGVGALLGAREGRAFWSAARSFLALHLVLVGAILFVVGLSERRARALYNDSVRNDPEAKSGGKASDKDSAKPS